MKQPSFMTWSRRTSWPKFTAGNPAATLRFNADDPKWRKKLDRFIKEHHRKRRLLGGFFSYDLGRSLLGVKSRHRPDGIPDGYILAFDTYLHDRELKIPKSIDGPTFERKPRPTLSRAAYGKAFRSVQRHIEAGDVYQLNLTHRLEGKLAVSPLELFHRLKRSSPGSLLTLIDGGDFSLISASPERFVRIKGGVITTAPIKGTRPRGATPTTDKRLRSELISSEKERAELNMITDLLRNDLGKICTPGSVQVTARRRVTAHPTIWHTHSEIRGTLQEELGPIDALLELLPGGSISGCPKKRAVEIIDELEANARGPYTGTAFALDPDGTLDSSILIRTLVQQNGRSSLSVGGGIVYGATEAAEYQESLDKAKVFTEL
jgi:para-aminobenzoate synthetase component 1